MLFSAEYLTSQSRALDLWTIWPEEVLEDIECNLLVIKVIRGKVQWISHLVAVLVTQHHHLAFIARDLVSNYSDIRKGSLGEALSLDFVYILIEELEESLHAFC